MHAKRFFCSSHLIWRNRKGSKSHECCGTQLKTQSSKSQLNGNVILLSTWATWKIHYATTCNAKLTTMPNNRHSQESSCNRKANWWTHNLASCILSSGISKNNTPSHSFYVGQQWSLGTHKTHALSPPAPPHAQHPQDSPQTLHRLHACQWSSSFADGLHGKTSCSDNCSLP